MPTEWRNGLKKPTVKNKVTDRGTYFQEIQEIIIPHNL